MTMVDVALYASFSVASMSFMILQKGLDMWFIARSVYTTEYSSRPPAASRGRGDL